MFCGFSVGLKIVIGFSRESSCEKVLECAGACSWIDLVCCPVSLHVKKSWNVRVHVSGSILFVVVVVNAMLFEL